MLGNDFELITVLLLFFRDSNHLIEQFFALLTASTVKKLPFVIAIRCSTSLSTSWSYGLLNSLFSKGNSCF
jgi:hypothetical protein